MNKINDNQIHLGPCQTEFRFFSSNLRSHLQGRYGGSTPILGSGAGREKQPGMPCGVSDLYLISGIKGISVLGSHCWILLKNADPLDRSMLIITTLFLYFLVSPW